MEIVPFNPAIALKLRSLSHMPILFEGPSRIVFGDGFDFTEVKTEEENWVTVTIYKDGKFVDTEYFENTERGLQVHEDLKVQESEPQDTPWDFHKTACFRLWSILNSPV